MATAAAEIPTYELRIDLVGSDPLIWRQVRVPQTITLGKLHRLIQVVMGWENSHLHQFVIGDYTYSDPWFDLEETRSTHRVKLQSLVPERRSRKPFSFLYEYDFGDDWRHAVTVERRGVLEPGQPAVVCLAGDRAGPPEDCGGVWGYRRLLTALQDATHPEHALSQEWVGEDFDPARFDRAAINHMLARLR
ncbi:MAG TPA: plasmid pRiA4b ORF-3 family protein [Herpetosiphonaceae bacterium]